MIPSPIYCVGLLILATTYCGVDAKKVDKFPPVKPVTGLWTTDALVSLAVIPDLIRDPCLWFLLTGSLISNFIRVEDDSRCRNKSDLQVQSLDITGVIRYSTRILCAAPCLPGRLRARERIFYR